MNVKVRECQLDEMWSFIGKKEKNLDSIEKLQRIFGDAWIWIAFDAINKIVLAYVIGKRTLPFAISLLEEIKRVPIQMPDLFSSDQLDHYTKALLQIYGKIIYPTRKSGPGRPPNPRLVPPEDLHYVQVVKKIKEANLGLDWGAELRADRISSSVAEALREAGCKVTAVGVESGDPKILQRINKQQDLVKVRKGIDFLKEANIAVQGYFIIGLPGETEDSFTMTCEFLEKLELEPGIDRINFFAATPYPGTALYEHPDNFGVNILHENWDLYDNSHLIMDLNSIEFEELEKIFERGRKLEQDFNYSSFG